MNEELIKTLTELMKELTTTLKLLNQPQFIIPDSNSSFEWMCNCSTIKPCGRTDCLRKEFKVLK